MKRTAWFVFWILFATLSVAWRGYGQTFVVPYEGMLPTIEVGSVLWAGPPDELHRGDIVIFTQPVDEIRTQLLISETISAIERHRESHNELPTSIEIPDDDWGNTMRYEPVGTADYRVVSAGRDGRFGTSDDLDSRTIALETGDRCISPESLVEAKDYVKRIVGLGGDRLFIEDNELFVNGESVRVEGTERVGEEDRYWRAIIHADEHLGEAEYSIQFYQGTHGWGDFDEVTVREGYVFVVGDNRSNSSDSRCWGEVPVEDVVGVVSEIIPPE